MTSEEFSIDDAFETDDDDKIRLYGSTKETSPRKYGPKVRPNVRKSSLISVSWN